MPYSKKEKHYIYDTFLFHHFKMGLEICMEHGVSKLKEQSSLVDFQLVIGDTVDFYPNNTIVTTNGYYVRCNAGMFSAQGKNVFQKKIADPNSFIDLSEQKIISHPRIVSGRTEI